MTKPDYSTWYTKQAAADKLGVSTKTIEIYAKARKIQQARWKRPSGGPVLAVYAPADVDKLAGERNNASFVVPAPEFVGGRRGGKQNGHALERVADKTLTDARVRQVIDRLFEKSSEISQRFFLTIPEAVQVSGLSEAYLRRACHAGTITAILDGGWKIRRVSLQDHLPVKGIEP